MTLPREYPVAPIVGVGALVFREEEILLIRRGREPLKGEWSLPGGRLELGETLLEGVAREVLEETGLIVEPRAHVESLERIVRDPDGRIRYHYVLIDFLCTVQGGEQRAGDDATEVAWFPLAAIRSGEIPLAEFTRTVMEKAAAIRSSLL